MVEPEEKEQIVLPVNAGLRDGYIALLKIMCFEGTDNFWLEDLVNIISMDCGVSVDTSRDKCKQLIRFNLLKYLNSSLNGHRYRVIVFSKMGGTINRVDSWENFDRLIQSQFSGLVETDLVKIRMSMNNLEESGLREKAIREVELECKRLESAGHIHPGEDTIKSEFVTLEKETQEEAAKRFEKEMNASNVNPGE